MDETQRQDERLLAELGELLGRATPPPGWVIEAAKRSYTWRTVDAELAELTADSRLDREPAGVRGAAEPRALTFEARDLVIEVEVSVSGAERRMLGQLVPAQRARIEVRQDEEASTVEADELGRFVVERLRARPVSLRCHLAGRGPVVTEWVAV